MSYTSKQKTILRILAVAVPVAFVVVSVLPWGGQESAAQDQEKKVILDATLDTIAIKKDLPPVPAKGAAKRHQKKQAHVEPFLQEKDILDFCQKFVQYLNAENYKAASRHILKYAIDDVVTDKHIISQIKDAIGKMRKVGDCAGVDLIQEKKAGNFAKKIIMVAKYSNWFLKLEFIFYSPASEDKWKLYDLTMSDSFEGLFTTAQ